MTSFTWLKEKFEDLTLKFNESVQSLNDSSKKYNDLKSGHDKLKGDHSTLAQKYKDSQAVLFAREAELEKVKERADYYEDKCTSIEMYTTVKLRAEAMKQYSEGQASS